MCVHQLDQKENIWGYRKRSKDVASITLVIAVALQARNEHGCFILVHLRKGYKEKCGAYWYIRKKIFHKFSKSRKILENMSFIHNTTFPNLNLNLIYFAPSLAKKRFLFFNQDLTKLKRGIVSDTFTGKLLD